MFLDQHTLPSVLRVHVVDVQVSIGGGHQQPRQLLDPGHTHTHPTEEPLSVEVHDTRRVKSLVCFLLRGEGTDVLQTEHVEPDGGEGPVLMHHV